MDISLVLLFAIIYVILYSSIFWLIVYFENRKNVRNDVLPKSFPMVSIVIPLYRGDTERGITNAVKSCLELNYPNYEVIVSWNGPHAPLLDFVKKMSSDKVKVIETEEKGKAAGMNHALEHIKGEFFCCLDGDSEFTPDAVRKMVGYFEDPKVAAVTSSMKVKEASTVMQKLQWMEYIFAIYLRRLMSFLNCLNVVPGPGSMYRTEVIRKVGGFKKDTITEDMEIAFRLHSYGYKIQNSIECLIYTESPETFKSLLNQRIRWYGGFCENAWLYRSFFFNKKKGVLGMFILPTSILWVFVLFYGLFRIGWDTWRWISDSIKSIALTGFHPLLMLQNWKDYFYFEPTYMTVFTVILTTIAIITIILSLRLARENLEFRKKFLNYFLYMFAYSFFLGIFWIMTGVYMLLRGTMLKEWVKW